MPVEGAPMRVVLIDCHANDRSFVRDESFRALADQLRADGVEADLLDLINDNPPPGKAMDDVRVAVRAAAPALVVVSRAWSAALFDALQQLMQHIGAHQLRLIVDGRVAEPIAIGAINVASRCHLDQQLRDRLVLKDGRI